MAQNFSVIKKIHSTRVRTGIFSGVLIASIFMILFLGFFQVSYGYTNGNVVDEGGYKFLPQLRDFDQDGKYELVLHTTRQIITEIHDDRTYGNNDANNILIIQADDGRVLSEYNFTRPNFVISYIDFMYGKNLSDIIDPLLFVQYAEVEEEENELTRDERVYRVRNETGYYETYILNMSALAVDKIMTNLTIIIPHRVTNLHHLIYNPLDVYPDLIVESVNYTLEEYGSGMDMRSIWFHALRADGTLMWTVNSFSSINSPLYTLSEFEREYKISGFQLNRTHFTFQNLNNGITTFRISDGMMEWNKTYLTIQMRDVLDSSIDFTGDGFPEVYYIYNNDSEELWLGLVNGVNGNQLNIPHYQNLNATQYINLKNLHRFDGDLYNYLAVFNYTTSTLHIYEQTDEFIEELYEITIPDFNYEMSELYKPYYYNYTKGKYFIFNYKTVRDVNKFSVIDLETGLFKSYADIDPENIIIGKFTNYEGIHLAKFNEYNVEYTYQILDSKRPYYRTTFANEITYYISIGFLAISIGLVVLSSRTMGKLKEQDRSSMGTFASEPEKANTSISLDKKDRTKKIGEGKSSVAFMKRFAIIIFIVMLSSVVMFIYFIFGSNMNNIYGSTETIAIRSAFITIALMFSSLPFISILYNQFATLSAIIYIKIQSFFYKILMKGRKNYKVVVLKLDYAKEFSFVTIISRSMMPILISLTVGLWIYQAFSTELFLTPDNALNMSFIGDFETYAGITFILTYIALMFIIPGGWLLDDCGVVYFDEPVKDHHPGDISKISSWLLNWLKGLFGITAVLNYYQLFKSFSFNIGGVTNDVVGALMMLVFVIGIMLIASPILYGILTMLLSNGSMIQDLEYNQKTLFEKMEKLGIDTTAYTLRDVFGQKSTSEHNNR